MTDRPDAPPPEPDPSNRPDPSTDPDRSAEPDEDTAAEPTAVVRPEPFSRRTVLAASLPAAAAVLGVTALTAPRPAGLGDPHGDEQLTSVLASHLDGHRTVAAAYLDGSGEVRFAGFGADEHREFEIGSVTKTFTGALLAEAIDRGEVVAETTVAEILGAEAESSQIADVTLAELATHTSGLPRLSANMSLGSIASTFLRKDPYLGRDGDTVIQDALASPLNGRGTFAYSNLGVGLQGQLLARIAGTDYASLLTDRILTPLEMTASSLPVVPENLADSAQRGHTATGLPSAAWTMDGHAPAGGLRSTPAEMARYLGATADGSAPGSAAATEVLFTGTEDSAGAMNWFQQDFGTGTMMTFHNGQTGGYFSFVGFDPATGRGIVLLTDTAASLDVLGVGILTGEVAL